MKRKESNSESVKVAESELYKNVRSILAKARTAVYVAANTAMVEAYWNVGREIVEKQGGESRAKYGDGLINSLAERLTVEFGPGFTRSNLRNMRQIYLMFPKCHTVCGKLSRTHRADAALQALLRAEHDEFRRQSAGGYCPWLGAGRGGDRLHAQ